MKQSQTLVGESTESPPISTSSISSQPQRMMDDESEPSGEVPRTNAQRWVRRPHQYVIGDALNLAMEKVESSDPRCISEHYLIIDDSGIDSLTLPTLRNHKDIPIFRCPGGCGGYRFSKESIDAVKCNGMETCFIRKKIYVRILSKLSPSVSRCQTCKCAFSFKVGEETPVIDGQELCWNCRKTPQAMRACTICEKHQARCISIIDGITGTMNGGTSGPFLCGGYSVCRECEPLLRASMLRELINRAKEVMVSDGLEKGTKEMLQAWIAKNGVDEERLLKVVTR
jgi:hypothetical protein